MSVLEEKWISLGKEEVAERLCGTLKASFSHSFRCCSIELVTRLPPKMLGCPFLNATSYGCAFCYGLVHTLNHKWNEEKKRSCGQELKVKTRCKGGVAPPGSSTATTFLRFATQRPRRFSCVPLSFLHNNLNKGISPFGGEAGWKESLPIGTMMEPEMHYLKSFSLSSLSLEVSRTEGKGSTISKEMWGGHLRPPYKDSESIIQPGYLVVDLALRWGGCKLRAGTENMQIIVWNTRGV